MAVLTSWEFWQRALVLLGPLLGFFSAWGLFELTERRKVRLAERALQEALVAELQHAELLLSSIVDKYAYVAKDSVEIKRVATEIRWFVDVGRWRAQAIGLGELPEPPAGFLSLPDEQLVAGFAQLTRRENVGVKLILPVVDSALAGHTSGFTAAKIQALSTVRWQAYLLEQDAEWMAEFLRLTFTVGDAGNHATVSENLDRKVRSYARRAGVLLQCVRTALTALGASGTSTV